ncbi:hypothetical protein Ais01nite_63190 [Asanoa ishikariensis]|uniref:Uncharacterized protein n=1 Tax=Asanoa ishikariensis TaxID=137265 RepID=A0A1H3NX32_9ACTN|nr:hypothetical protein [Asanoa ishikariensis]GIF68284.1 hypothetical protein Ais01nite_63190 [Asanoa ishikariensis]SDY93456.1 hypothetical protein SAMN05421684_2406 [Asanoa ishikariensis]
MPDLDELIRTTLDRHAAGEVDRDALISRAVGRGRSYRRRRRATLWGAAAVALVVAAGGTVAISSLRGGAGLEVGGRTPPAVALPAVSAPGAEADPAAVGTDPRLIHFAAPAIEAGARFHNWTSAAGYEQLEAEIDDALVSVTIGRSQAAVDAAERQSDGGAVVRSQPVPGLWLRIQAKDPAYAARVAAVVDLDRTQQLVLPFRLGHRPPGSVPVTAYLGFIDRVYAHGGVILRGADGARMEVQAQYSRGRTDRSGNHTVGGRPAFLYPGRDEVALRGVAHLEVSVRIGKAYQGYEVADADAVLAALTVTETVERITTWPTDN